MSKTLLIPAWDPADDRDGTKELDDHDALARSFRKPTTTKKYSLWEEIISLKSLSIQYMSILAYRVAD